MMVYSVMVKGTSIGGGRIGREGGNWGWDGRC